MKLCGQDCAVMCGNCKNYHAGCCYLKDSALAVDDFDCCDHFHCKRSLKD